MGRLIRLATMLLCMGQATMSLTRASDTSSKFEPRDNLSSQAPSSVRSDAGSSLDWSLGVLAMVRADAPDVPVYSWDAGTLECSEPTRSEIFYLKNFGSETIVLSSAPILPEINGFSRSTDCRCTQALTPGQMDACSFILSFNPPSDGVLRDTMRVQTDAWNGYGGFVRFPLSGERVSTPIAPQVVIVIQGSDVRLQWNAVAQSVFGCAIAPVEYRVYSSEQTNGTYTLRAVTADTTYLHLDAIRTWNGFRYLVTARTQ